LLISPWPRTWIVASNMYDLHPLSPFAVICSFFKAWWLIGSCSMQSIGLNSPMWSDSGLSSATTSPTLPSWANPNSSRSASNTLVHLPSQLKSNEQHPRKRLRQRRRPLPLNQRKRPRRRRQRKKRRMTHPRRRLLNIPSPHFLLPLSPSMSGNVSTPTMRPTSPSNGSGNTTTPRTSPSGELTTKYPPLLHLMNRS